MIEHQRAQLLIEQNRFALAEKELGQALAKDPQDATAHLLMAICCKHANRYGEATDEAEQAIRLQPDDSRAHLILGSIYVVRNRYAEAQHAVEEALRLDPYDEENYAMLASIHYDQKQWKEAFQYAEKGLEIDPDEPVCLSMRALSLERMGQGNVAVDFAEDSLSSHPDDSFSHATLAHTLLNNGQHKKAQESFREALRLDPTNEFARQGMIQALNSNNILFRWVFTWYTFMGRFSDKMQWAIVLGMYFGQMVLRQLSRSFPALRPFVLPIIVVYVAFCVMTWIANPLFNTFLRFNRYGKHLLDNRQIMASNVIVGTLLFGVTTGVALGLLNHSVVGLLLGIGFSMFMLLPISAMFQCEEGYPTMIMAIATAVLGMIGLIVIGAMFLSKPLPVLLVPIFIIGAIGSQFLGNYMASVTVKH